MDEPLDRQWTEYLAAPTREARDRLVVRYTPLVRVVAHRVLVGLPTHVDHADLTQSGIFGLIDAIERFDPERCPRFESFAVQRIRGAILDELRAQDWVPRTVRGRVRELERAQERLERQLQRAATDREIAAEMQLPLREVQGLIRQVQVVERGGAGRDRRRSGGPLRRRGARPDVRGAGAGDDASAQRGRGRARRARPDGRAALLPGEPDARRDRAAARGDGVARVPAARTPRRDGCAVGSTSWRASDGPDLTGPATARARAADAPAAAGAGRADRGTPADRAAHPSAGRARSSRGAPPRGCRARSPALTTVARVDGSARAARRWCAGRRRAGPTRRRARRRGPRTTTVPPRAASTGWPMAPARSTPRWPGPNGSSGAPNGASTAGGGSNGQPYPTSSDVSTLSGGPRPGALGAAVEGGAARRQDGRRYDGDRRRRGHSDTHEPSLAHAGALRRGWARSGDGRARWGQPGPNGRRGAKRSGHRAYTRRAPRRPAG